MQPRWRTPYFCFQSIQPVLCLGVSTYNFTVNCKKKDVSTIDWSELLAYILKTPWNHWINTRNIKCMILEKKSHKSIDFLYNYTFRNVGPIAIWNVYSLEQLYFHKLCDKDNLMLMAKNYRHYIRMLERNSVQWSSLR